MIPISQYFQNKYSASALILLTLILVVGAISNILSDRRSDIDRLLNGRSGVTAGGSYSFYQIECNTPSECDDILEVFESLRETISDPQYELFLNTTSETIRLYTTGQHSSWGASIEFNLGQDESSLSNIFRIDISSSSNGAAETILSTGYTRSIPTQLEHTLKQFASNSDEFHIYLDEREQYLSDLEFATSESNHSLFDRIASSMKAFSKRTISLILFFGGTMTALYGSYVLLSVVVLKRKEGELSIERAMTALAISLPVLLALSST